MHTVRVNRKAAERVLSGHPWIFSSDVVDRADAQPGDAVRVISEGRGGSPGSNVLGTAHYSSSSQITLRMLSREGVATDVSFFRERLQAAISHRAQIVENSDAYRLVFSEADLLPGLIVDRYGQYLVMQTLTQGMDLAQDTIVEVLKELLTPSGILARNDATVRRLEDLPQKVVTLAGDIPDHVDITMNGLILSADLMKGQKTGIYLDQRENYLAVERWTSALKIQRVLDCFTSTGGFALHAARHAQSVEAIDSSAHAIAIAEANALANNITNIQFREADVFDFLSGAANRHYDLVILDPPAFAKSRKDLDAAARGYKDINLRALRMLERGGILVTCSCSHHMSEGLMYECVAQAALDAGKTLRVLERRTQATDHPILLTVPETLYLKCLILQVV